MRLLTKILRFFRREYLIKVKGKEAYARSLGVQIGHNCDIHTKYFSTEPFLIKIGNSVTLAEDVKLITHDGSGRLFGKIYHYAKIEIGDNVFVGMNAIILPGVKIGNNVIVGAGSVLTKSIPSNSVVAGNPAKYVMSFDEFVENSAEKFKFKKDVIEGDIKAQIWSVVNPSFRKELEALKRENY